MQVRVIMVIGGAVVLFSQLILETFNGTVFFDLILKTVQVPNGSWEEGKLKYTSRYVGG